MKKRNLVIGLLIMLSVIVSGFTFAFWASGVNGNQNVASGSVTIGQGGVAETVVTVDDQTLGNALLPKTQSTTNNNINLIFNVNWAEDATIQLQGSTVTGTLTATAVFVRIDKQDETNSGLNVTAIESMFTLGTPVYQGGNQTITMGTQKQVTINLEFTTEPATKAIYDLIQQGKIVIQVTFVVSGATAVTS